MGAVLLKNCGSGRLRLLLRKVSSEDYTDLRRRAVKPNPPKAASTRA